MDSTETRSPSTPKAPRPRLGRGLSSLIVRSTPPEPDGSPSGHYAADVGPSASSQQPTAPKAGPDPGGEPLALRGDQIGPNPHQPRREFDEASIAQLADSIARQGILQPIVIARAPAGTDGPPYVLVAGERRLRAARKAGLATVPCLLREATEQQMLEWAMIENIHRKDLNPIERAQAYRSYMDRFSLSQAEAGERLGQPRATVANYLRILDLCEYSRAELTAGRLSFGHAKVLAALAERPAAQERLARRAVQEGLSVRHLERLVREARDESSESARRRNSSKPPYIRDLEERLTQAVGTRAAIRPGRAKNTGRIVLDYYSLDDFERITGALGLPPEA